ncbi:hypothetical protein NM688_g3244 [Phlebia brevispora]|uniref:Uncharacterized protein n=1 Tax=Phlebia brevispora TaxID=194682 RepID=A0ACC1T669_9APHY|nr:hypothetical protein NM688_g3244 [Phlebia brevispora]
MAEIAVGAALPSFLNNAWSIYTTTSQLCSTVKYRRKQFQALLDRCQDIIQQIASSCQKEPEIQDDVMRGTNEIEGACDSVKGVLETVNEKGFLWCLMNAEKLDFLIKDCDGTLEKMFRVIYGITQSARVRKMARARDEDMNELSQSLSQLSQDETRLLEAIQDQGGVHRTPQELLVALLKHVQNHPLQSNARPEDVFISNAHRAICRLSNTRETSTVAAFVISSVEVEFNLHSPIGRGASGQVYRGDWNGAVVAVKRMHTHDAQVISDEQRKALRHEVRIWSTLHHPNVLTFYGACLEAEVPFLVMKYCPYGALPHYLAKYPEADRTKLSYEVSVGLAFLHSKGIVHADVKGANVLISEDHHALLSDFGLALKLFQFRSQSTFSSNIDRRRGTLLYMAPEVLQGQSPDTAADVYSLGLTIWEIYSDEVPFQSYLSAELLIDGVVTRQRRPDRPKSMSQDYVWNIMQKCWRAIREERPTAKEVQDVLRPVDEHSLQRTQSSLFSDPGLFEDGEDAFTSSTSTFASSSSTLTVNTSTGSAVKVSEWNQRTVTPGNFNGAESGFTSTGFSGFQNDSTLLDSGFSLVSEVSGYHAVASIPNAFGDIPSAAHRATSHRELIEPDPARVSEFVETAAAAASKGTMESKAGAVRVGTWLTARWSAAQRYA